MYFRHEAKSLAIDNWIWELLDLKSYELH